MLLYTINRKNGQPQYSMSQCYYDYCAYDCCNFYGYCPEDYSYYYAILTTLTIIMSPPLFACVCYRRRQQTALEQQFRATSMNSNYVDGSTVIIQQPQQPAYGQPYYLTPRYYGQQNYGHPINGQNFIAPVVFDQPAYFPSQQPIIITAT